eukprot:4931406-Prymnesium_polylepis.1
MDAGTPEASETAVARIRHELHCPRAGLRCAGVLPWARTHSSFASPHHGCPLLLVSSSQIRDHPSLRREGRERCPALQRSLQSVRTAAPRRRSARLVPPVRAADGASILHPWGQAPRLRIARHRERSWRLGVHPQPHRLPAAGAARSCSVPPPERLPRAAARSRRHAAAGRRQRASSSRVRSSLAEPPLWRGLRSAPATPGHELLPRRSPPNRSGARGRAGGSATSDAPARLAPSQPVTGRQTELATSQDAARCALQEGPRIGRLHVPREPARARRGAAPARWPARGGAAEGARRDRSASSSSFAR